MVRIFGQSMKKGTRYQRQMGAAAGSSHSKRDATKSDEEILAARRAERRRIRKQEGEELDERFGYGRFDHRSDTVVPKRGWLFNMLPTVCSHPSCVVSAPWTALYEAMAILANHGPFSSFNITQLRFNDRQSWKPHLMILLVQNELDWTSTLFRNQEARSSAPYCTSHTFISCPRFRKQKTKIYFWKA